MPSFWAIWYWDERFVGPSPSTVAPIAPALEFQFCNPVRCLMLHWLFRTWLSREKGCLEFWVWAPFCLGYLCWGEYCLMGDNRLWKESFTGLKFLPKFFPLLLSASSALCLLWVGVVQRTSNWRTWVLVLALLLTSMWYSVLVLLFTFVEWRHWSKLF